MLHLEMRDAMMRTVEAILQLSIRELKWDEFHSEQIFLDRIIGGA